MELYFEKYVNILTDFFFYFKILLANKLVAGFMITNSNN